MLLHLLRFIMSDHNKLSCLAYMSVFSLSVCNVRVRLKFRQCFYSIWYLGHLLPLDKNFTEIVPGEPLRRGSS